MWVCAGGGYRCCCGNGGCAVVVVVDDDGEELIYYFKNKVSLQTSLEKNSSNFSYISFLGVNFENLRGRLVCLFKTQCSVFKH